MNSKIEKLKLELEQTVNNPKSKMEDIIKISSNIDKEIEKIYEQKEMKELLNTANSQEIKTKIKDDLTGHYYNISQLEVDILAENIYDYCCLMVNNMSEQDIITYITKQNANYYDQLSDKDRKNMTSEFNIKFYKHLIKKYCEIIKNTNNSQS